MRRCILFAVAAALLLLCSCGLIPTGSHPVTPIDNEPIRNVPDVDVPQYTLTLVDGHVVADVDYVVNLDVSGREKVRILNFADIHLSNENIANEEMIGDFRDTVDYLISQANPDLITLTGDQIPSGERKAFEYMGDMINSYGIPWAPVYGNHDCEGHGGGLDLHEQSELYCSYSNCLYKDGPQGLNRIYNTGEDSLGHYVINLVKIEGGEFKVIRSLIFINSGADEHYDAADYPGQRRYADFNYACLNRNQIEWYLQMARSVQQYGEDGQVPCGIIMHMASFGYVYAASAAFDYPYDIYDTLGWKLYGKLTPYSQSLGTSIWNKGYESSYGTMHEEICGPPYDEGMFSAMKESGCTDFIIVGHDHVNNFNIKYQGINFVYAMKTGRFSYHASQMMGGTLITVSSDGKATFDNIRIPYLLDMVFSDT